MKLQQILILNEHRKKEPHFNDIFMGEFRQIVYQYFNMYGKWENDWYKQPNKADNKHVTITRYNTKDDKLHSNKIQLKCDDFRIFINLESPSNKDTNLYTHGIKIKVVDDKDPFKNNTDMTDIYLFVKEMLDDIVSTTTVKKIIKRMGAQIDYFSESESNVVWVGFSVNSWNKEYFDRQIQLDNIQNYLQEILPEMIGITEAPRAFMTTNKNKAVFILMPIDKSITKRTTQIDNILWDQIDGMHNIQMVDWKFETIDNDSVRLKLILDVSNQS